MVHEATDYGDDRDRGPGVSGIDVVCHESGKFVELAIPGSVDDASGPNYVQCDQSAALGNHDSFLPNAVGDDQVHRPHLIGGECG